MTDKPKVLSPREANGPDGYPKDNPEFDRLWNERADKNKGAAAAARKFLEKLREMFSK